MFSWLQNKLLPGRLAASEPAPDGDAYLACRPPHAIHDSMVADVVF